MQCLGVQCHYTCTGKAILCLVYSTKYLVPGHLSFTKANGKYKGKHGKIQEYDMI